MAHYASTLMVGGVSIKPSTPVRNLSAIFDQSVNLQDQVNSIKWFMYFHIHMTLFEINLK